MLQLFDRAGNPIEIERTMFVKFIDEQEVWNFVFFDREQRSRGPRNMKGCDGDGDGDGDRHLHLFELTGQPGIRQTGTCLLQEPVIWKNTIIIV